MSPKELPVVCARCHGQLARAVDTQVCSGCGSAYGSLDGVPVLVADADHDQVDLRSRGGALPTFDSATMGIPALDGAFAQGGRILELGAGLDVNDAPNLVKTDAYVFAGATLDVVADAHALPFPDATFDFVFSLAVFEHLHSPWQAASEIARVLKPGGHVYTLAAFLQPLHGYPDHFFNATESGLARLFSDGFEVVSAGPSRHCPHRQSLVPLDRMREMTRALAGQGSRLPWRTRLRAWRLERALQRASHEFMQLAEPASRDPEGFAAWRQIAPAVEVHAVRR